MEVSGLNALDVLIGLVFMYFLLSLVCSAINESIAQVFALRSKTLATGVRNLLGGKEPEFWKDWRIEALAQPRSRLVKWIPGVGPLRRPSYIDARTFALVALDTLGTAREAGDTTPNRDVIASMRTNAARIENDAVRHQLLSILDASRTDLDALRRELETSFDHVMDRASGWYKRRVQIILTFIAIGVTVGLNADSFQVASRLWKDDALRAAVVAKATAAAVEDQPQAGDTPDAVAKNVDRIEELQLPLGWKGKNKGAFWEHVPGWLVTALALTLGAPFWFDVLGRLAKVRAAGNREGTAKDDDRAAEDRDDPSGVRPATR